MNHIMLDLETLSTAHNAAIVSVGAVLFDPENNRLGKEFYQVVALSDDPKDGVTDASTVGWWLAQSDEARSVFASKAAKPLKEVLSNFSFFVEEHCGTQAQVWGNGATFDNIILSSAYRRHGLKQPWSFRSDRDVRTVVELGRALRNLDAKTVIRQSGTAHNALDDARYQAQYVCAIYAALDNR